MMLIPYVVACLRIPCLPLVLVISAFLLPVASQAEASSAAAGSQNRRQSETTYQDTTLTEDVSWRGTILIKGYLAIAPQATLRIEPGTVIRFMPSGSGRQLPRLVVLGRIQATGTGERPILFLPRQAKVVKGAWGGIQLLSSEKRNHLEHCRIEGAETGIDARFSSLTTRSVTVTASAAGLVLRDSTAGMNGTAISSCDTGMEAHDSELELRDSSFSGNQTGMVLARSSVVMASVSVRQNTRLGIQGDDCRLKISSCDISGNAAGARFNGGEGMLFLSRFLRNRDTALHLSAARFKINRCRVADNERDGVLMEDGRATAWDNDFGGNKGANLVYRGQERASVVRNWWGTADESSLMAKITVGRSASVLQVYPWLDEKPAVTP